MRRQGVGTAWSPSCLDSIRYLDHTRWAAGRDLDKDKISNLMY